MQIRGEALGLLLLAGCIRSYDKAAETALGTADRYGPDGRSVEAAAARYYQTQKPFAGVFSALAAYNGQPTSFSPKAGLVYISPLTPQDAARQPLGFNVGLNFSEGMLPHDPKVIAGATKATVGAPVAIDPVGGKERWRVDYPVAWDGGTMATASLPATKLVILPRHRQPERRSRPPRARHCSGTTVRSVTASTRRAAA